jgi:hypothetical protein
MKDQTWTTLFEVKERWLEDGDIGSCWLYDIINIHSSSVIGTYKDRKYAKRQARYKYKKIVKLTEKSFMSLT